MSPMLIMSISLLSLIRWASADCESYGVDFVDGGGPYCINTTSTDYFSFGSSFLGCQTSDSQGDITPILINPNGDEYFCSDIPITPEGQDFISTCDVPGNEVVKSQMFSGEWMAVIEGLTFAYMRSFSILAGSPVTITQTPTATFTVTTVPSTTITTTSTAAYSSTLSPATVTVPSTTSTKTITKTPSKVTVTSTKCSTVTRTTRVFSKTVITTTLITPCYTQPHRKDPTCTIHPAKASYAANAINGTLPGRFRRPRGDGHWLGHRRNDAIARLAERTPDLCTTTSLETSTVVSSYTTITAPTSTETDTTIVTSTVTITPPPVTAYFGIVNQTITITASTPTRTVVKFGRTTTWTTKTIWATITSTVKRAPTGVICATRA